MKSGRGGAGKAARGGKKQSNQSTLFDFDTEMQLPENKPKLPAEILPVTRGKP